MIGPRVCLLIYMFLRRIYSYIFADGQFVYIILKVPEKYVKVVLFVLIDRMHNHLGYHVINYIVVIYYM
jgi:hypothetical protein